MKGAINYLSSCFSYVSSAISRRNYNDSRKRMERRLEEILENVSEELASIWGHEDEKKQ